MKYLFTWVCILGLLGCQSENPENTGEEPDPLTSGLIAYFPLDSTFNDNSGNDAILQVHGTPDFADGYDSLPASAILLDGYDDYLEAAIGVLDTFTISMWIYSYRYFVGEWPHWRSTLFDYSGKQVYGFIDGVSGATQINCGIDAEPVTGIVPDNSHEWFHLVVAVSDKVQMYHNGILSNTAPLHDGTIYAGDILYLGRASQDEEIELTYFYGLLDEVRVYNRILDPQEIAELSAGIWDK